MLLFFLLALSPAISHCQFNKCISANATAHFNIATSGLSPDDAGVGVNLQTSFFAKHKVQLTTEAVSELFFGNKVFYEDPQTGKNAKASMHSIRIGPQVFLTKNIAVAATYGLTWHKIREFDYSADDGYKLSINSFVGKSRRMVAKASFVTIPAESRRIQYLSFGLGYRF